MKKRMRQVRIIVLALVILFGAAIGRTAGSESTVIRAAVAEASIKLNMTKATIYVGNTLQLRIGVKNTKASWSSSRRSIASVSSNGGVTGSKNGITTITADVDGRKFTCRITVKNSIDVRDVPAYSGKPCCIINKNEPFFTSGEKKSEKSAENYSDLDSLNRCQKAYANICREIMPTEKRGKIGMVKPAGWHTIKYNCVDGRYLYNRCHLIAYELAGENANEKNLITGTRYMNVTGMLPYENKVTDYVKDTGNHVLYRATPVYKGNNLLASGVLLEGYSVEDKGEGICFNVYCYNVQPGVSISYKDGSSSIDVNPNSMPNTDSDSNTSADANTNTNTYILNTNTKKIHRSTCYSIKQMSESNKSVFKGSIDDLLKQGYSKCRNCNP